MSEALVRPRWCLVFAALPVLAFAAESVWPPPQDTTPFEVQLEVGEVFPICGAGGLICPVGNAVCDDLKVAAPVEVPDGIGWKGIGPGVTLCGASAASGQGARHVFRVTVR
jgi:hypothetical protein